MTMIYRVLKYAIRAFIFLLPAWGMTAPKSFVSQGDSLKASQFEEFAWTYMDANPDSANYYAQQGLAIALMAGQQTIAAHCYSIMGYLFKKAGKLDSAESYFSKSNLLRDQEGIPEERASGRNQLGWLRIKQDRPEEAIQLFEEGLAILSHSEQSKVATLLFEGIGHAMQKMGRDDSALEAYQKALGIHFARKDSIGAAKTLQNMGTFFASTGRPVIAIAHYQRAQHIYQAQHNERGIAETEMNWGMAEYEMGNNHAAIPHLLKAQKISEQLGYAALLSDLYNNLGLAYQNEGLIDQAIEFIERDFAFCQEQGLTSKAAIAAINLAGLVQEQKEYAYALALADSAEKYNGHDITVRKGIYEIRAKAFGGLGQYETAFLWSTKKQHLKDSTDNLIRESQNLADKYLTEKSQREKAEADAKTAAAELNREKAENKNKRYLLMGIILLILLAGVVGGQWYRSRIAKLTFAAREQKRLEEQRQELKEAEWRAVRLSMETGEQERQRIAKNLHDTLGSKLSVIQMNFQSLLRNVNFQEEKHQIRYKEGIQHLDEACQEVRRISRHMAQGDLSHYGLQLALERYTQQVQESSEMCVHFRVMGTPRKLTPHQETEIYAMLGTAIENVIRHAKAQNIHLELSYQTDILGIRLSDDGQGFDKEKIKDKKGLGLKNIAERVERLGAQHRIHTQPGEGTTLEIDIPMEYIEK